MLSFKENEEQMKGKEKGREKRRDIFRSGGRPSLVGCDSLILLLSEACGPPAEGVVVAT